MKKELARLEKIRNVGIIAHIDAGKTTVSERMLYYTHKIHRMGEVHDGNATMDFMPEEQERGITITAASTFCEWDNHDINLIDTPGHVDFTIEVERSLRVLDGAVGIFCAVGGVEPQSETVWRQSEALGVPKLAFINKMDRIGANFEIVLEAIKERLGANPLAIQIPLGEGEEFYAVADLIKKVKLEFDEEDQGETFYTRELEGEEIVLVDMWREKMLESLADIDETFLDIYITEKHSEADIIQALRRVCIARLATPTLMGSALKNTGIQPLLDALCMYLPSPLDVEPLRELYSPYIQSNQEKAEKKTTPNKEECAEVKNTNPFQALIFKVILENKRKIALLRLYNGTLNEGMPIRNITQNSDERISHMYRLHADFREDIETAKAGDIVAVMGMKMAKTGDTLGMHGDDHLLENLFEYKPVISLAFEPKNSEDADVLDEALERYALEDPTLTVQLEEVSGNRLVSGMGELHLDVLQERIVREYKIQARVGNPQVVLRETMQDTNPIQAHVIFNKELGEATHHGDITLTLSARKRGEGNLIEFAKDLQESEVSEKSQNKSTQAHKKNVKENSTLAPQKKLIKELQVFQAEILQSIHDTLLSGPQTGYPLQDIHLTITAMNKTNISTQIGFQMATSLAIKEALTKAKLLILEPIMSVEIQAYDENLGACINLFNTCGGKVEEVQDRAGLKCVSGLAPMRELFGFSTRLRSVSQGRAGLLMRFHSYNN